VEVVTYKLHWWFIRSYLRGLPCAERHLELLIMTYADFDRKYIICPEETLAIYGLLKNVDD
jgi:hypothetical protein